MIVVSDTSPITALITIPLSSLNAMENGTRPIKKHRATLEKFFGVEIEEISTPEPMAAGEAPGHYGSIHDEMDAQWWAQGTDQLIELLQHRVDRRDWGGAVQLIACKLLDRDLTEFNEKLLKGKHP